MKKLVLLCALSLVLAACKDGKNKGSDTSEVFSPPIEKALLIDPMDNIPQEHSVSDSTALVSLSGSDHMKLSSSASDGEDFGSFSADESSTNQTTTTSEKAVTESQIDDAIDAAKEDLAPVNEELSNASNDAQSILDADKELPPDQTSDADNPSTIAPKEEQRMEQKPESTLPFQFNEQNETPLNTENEASEALPSTTTPTTSSNDSDVASSPVPETTTFPEQPDAQESQSISEQPQMPEPTTTPVESDAPTAPVSMEEMDQPELSDQQEDEVTDQTYDDDDLLNLVPMPVELN